MSPTQQQRRQKLPPTVPTSIEEQYGDAAYSDFVEANADFYHYYLHYSFFQKLRDYTTRRPAGQLQVLDMGCGNAILSRKIWHQFNTFADDEQCCCHVYAIDVTNAMLEKAQKLCGSQNIPLLQSYDAKSQNRGIFFQQGNLLNTNDTSSIPRHQFDLTISGFVLAHLTSSKDIETVMALAFDALSPGGLSLHLIPATPTDMPVEGAAFQARLPHQDREIILYDVHWSDETYVQAMKKAGFVSVTIQELDYHPNTTEAWKQANGNPSGYKLLTGKRREKL